VLLHYSKLRASGTLIFIEDLVTSDWGVAGDDGGGIVSGWMLAQALVWPVVIEMANVLIRIMWAWRVWQISIRSVHSARTLPMNRSA